jgi:hypothetical protein
MAELSIGDAVGAGFGVIRRRPAAVLLWGLLQTAMFGAMLVVMAPMYLAMFAEVARNAGAGHAPTPDMGNLMQIQAMTWLLNLATAFVVTILYCAVFRSLIHPEQGSFGYLRLGVTELMLFLLMIGAYIALVVAMVILVIPAALVVGLLVAAHATAAAVIAGVLLGLGALWGLVYVALRVSMVGPMMVDDGRFHLLDAWALTKGRAGALLLLALCLLGILIALEMVVVIAAWIVGVSVLSSGAGAASAIPALFRQPPALVLSHLAPLLAIGGVVAIPLYGAVLAIFGAPWARAYLDFRVDPAAVF